MPNNISAVSPANETPRSSFPKTKPRKYAWGEPVEKVNDLESARTKPIGAESSQQPDRWAYKVEHNLESVSEPRKCRQYTHTVLKIISSLIVLAEVSAHVLLAEKESAYAAGHHSFLYTSENSEELKVRDYFDLHLGIHNAYEQGGDRVFVQHTNMFYNAFTGSRGKALGAQYTPLEELQKNFPNSVLELDIDISDFSDLKAVNVGHGAAGTANRLFSKELTGRPPEYDHFNLDQFFDSLSDEVTFVRFDVYGKNESDKTAFWNAISAKLDIINSKRTSLRELKVIARGGNGRYVIPPSDISEVGLGSSYHRVCTYSKYNKGTVLLHAPGDVEDIMYMVNRCLMSLLDPDNKRKVILNIDDVSKEKVEKLHIEFNKLFTKKLSQSEINNLSMKDSIDTYGIPKLYLYLVGGNPEAQGSWTDAITNDLANQLNEAGESTLSLILRNQKGSKLYGHPLTSDEMESLIDQTDVSILISQENGFRDTCLHALFYYYDNLDKAVFEKVATKLINKLTPEQLSLINTDGYTPLQALSNYAKDLDTTVFSNVEKILKGKR